VGAGQRLRWYMNFDDGIFGLYSRLYENRREVELSLEEYLGKCSDDPSYYAGAAELMLRAISELRLYGEPVKINAKLSRRKRRRARRGLSGCCTSTCLEAGAAPAILMSLISSPQYAPLVISAAAAVASAAAAWAVWQIHRRNQAIAVWDKLQERINNARSVGEFRAMREIVEEVKAHDHLILFQSAELYDKAGKALTFLCEAARTDRSPDSWEFVLNGDEQDLVHAFLQTMSVPIWVYRTTNLNLRWPLPKCQKQAAAAEVFHAMRSRLSGVRGPRWWRRHWADHKGVGRRSGRLREPPIAPN
jgi:hypothetical protein